ncbi:MAG: hypothetical protein H8E78_05500 [Proteobacteria bacterium]|nr:hypothetical protein [Pseudomonadota bacterium]
MGQLWTDEMEEHWQAVLAEAANPKDFLIAHDITIGDRLKGLFEFTRAAVAYWAAGGDKPSISLRMQIDFANTARQLGPERIKECDGWLAADFDGDDPFEGFRFDET